MSDPVLNFLSRLGLSEHFNRFLEDGIDFEVLPHLVDSDLRELGLRRLGDRKKVLVAAQRLNPESAWQQSESILNAQLDNGVGNAERRQLSVLFCDLVGSTSLSVQLDPEEYREAIKRYQDAVVGAVTRYGGFVAKFLGDGVLVYFGWPKAFEDQAERSIRAGLNAIAAVGNVNIDGIPPLSARVGVASGQIVIGDLSGENDAVTGETPNLAARLQAEAEPNQVVIAKSTQTLVEGAFELTALGNRQLKGFGDLPAWRVDREIITESRFEAARRGKVLPLFGRQNELDELLEYWRLASAGKGQFVLLSGEAGIGKSRLVRALRESMPQEAHFRLRYQCSPLFQNSAFFPIIQRLEREAGFSLDDGPDAKFLKLEKMLDLSSSDVVRDAPLFAKLLSIETPERVPDLELSPRDLRDHAIDAMVKQVLGLGRRRPVMFLLEDAHWIDKSTESLIGDLVSRIENTPVLLLVTYRPDEYLPPWSDISVTNLIGLQRLPPDHGREIVRIIAKDELSDRETDEILERGDGVPLFVEELARMRIESGDQGVPASLQALLAKRLDEVGDAKEIAQIGSVFGREFNIGMVGRFLDDPDTDVSPLMDRLVRSELVFQVGRRDAETYVFKHALIQDAAYGSLLIAQRRRLHDKVATLMLSVDVDAVQQHEVLARHLSGAGRHLEAAEQWYAAGQRASLLSASEETKNCYRSGLDEVEKEARSAQSDLLTFDLRLALASHAFYSEGPKSEAAERAYLWAQEASDRIEDTERLNALSWGLWALYWNRGDTKSGAAYAYQQLDRIDSESHPYAVSVAHRSVSVSEMTLGKFHSSNRHAGIACAAIASHDDGKTAARFGHDLNISAHMMLALCKGLLGQFDEATGLARETVQSALELRHSASLSYAAFFAGLLQVLVRTQIFDDDMIAEFDDRAEFIWFDNRRDVLGGLAIVQAKYAEGLKLMSDWQDLPIYSERSTRIPYVDIAFRAIYAEGQLTMGDRDGAKKVIEDTVRLIEETGFTWWSAECFRLRAELQLADDNLGAATELYWRAIEIAGEQNAGVFRLRSVNALARLLIQQGQKSDAKILLREAVQNQSSGVPVPDLVDASAMLSELQLKE